MAEIRDPVHGPIHLSPAELRVVDSAPYQRLRHIKQLGFGEMTFPGATHNRYLHGLGAMHLAGRAFDSALAGAEWLPAAEAKRLRQTVRLSALLHDAGHPPLSHTVEAMLAPVTELPDDIRRGRSVGACSHEDMTLLLVTRSDLTTAIDDGFADVGVQASHVAGLIDPDLSVDGDVYRAAGRDLRPLLTQLVSSELDVDRMDYLLRDSYFTGVTYGRYDLDWLVAGLTHHEGEGGALHLALSERALFTFEDFLLSRLHMFVMVYFHHHTNMYDRMLVRFLEGLGDSARFPADPVAYCDQDDTRIWSLLREHRHDPWARRVLSKDPLKRVADLQDAEAGHRDTIDVELRARGMEPEWITSKGVLSRYWGRSDKARIFVLREALAGGRRAVPLENATDLFRRYSEPTVLVRVYVEPARQQEARGVVAGVIGA